MVANPRAGQPALYHRVVDRAALVHRCADSQDVARRTPDDLPGRRAEPLAEEKFDMRAGHY